MTKIASLIFAALLAPTLAFAQPTLSLTADASSKVANDEMVVTLSLERAGPDSAPLTDTVLSGLNGAVAEAKAVPGVKVQMGNVSTSPNWDQNKKIGWQVRGAVVLTSKDMKALSTLAGKLSAKLQLTGVSFRLSDALRSTEEARLIQVAADNFKAKAIAASRAFGYADYALSEVTLSQSQNVIGMPMPMGIVALKTERASLPVEGGDSEVLVSVTGKIEMK